METSKTWGAYKLMMVNVAKIQETLSVLPFVSGEYLVVTEEELEIRKESLYKAMNIYRESGHDPLDALKGLINL